MVKNLKGMPHIFFPRKERKGTLKLILRAMMFLKSNVFNSSSNSIETSWFCKLVTHTLSHLILMSSIVITILKNVSSREIMKPV